jgi:hypothetical protein
MMKPNKMLTDYSELDEKSAESLANLDKMQRCLWIGLGSVLTYAALAMSVSEPFFDSFTSIFLWIMLLLAPAIAGIVVLKFPSWQEVPLMLRKNVILQSFGLSFLTLSTTIVFFVRWSLYQPGLWIASSLISICFGAFMIWLNFRLGQRVAHEMGDLFP